MKELMSTARNICAVMQDHSKKAITTIEVIFTVFEPQYRIDAGGELIRSRVPETMRLTTTPARLRQVAASFIEWADDADKWADEAFVEGMIDTGIDAKNESG
jgi:hypothetical protein